MKLDFNKVDGLVPVIVQDSDSMQVLMLGYMNEDALQKTMTEKVVTFYSRSKKRLWTKGETSGNILRVVEMEADCDSDALLVLAKPAGPTCHKGSTSCFGEKEGRFVYELENTIVDRMKNGDAGSYTRALLDKGINKVAQKVGEEAVELVIESKDDNRDLFLGEAADLMYHYLLLLQAKDCSLQDVEEVLIERSAVRNNKIK